MGKSFYFLRQCITDESLSSGKVKIAINADKTLLLKSDFSGYPLNKFDFCLLQEGTSTCALASLICQILAVFAVGQPFHRWLA